MERFSPEQTLGRRIRCLRLIANLSQCELATRAGVSPRALRSLEHGAGSTVATLLRLLHALGREDEFVVLAPEGEPLAVADYCQLATRKHASSCKPVLSPPGREDQS
ncbi:helix-turn-helix domain-containing protein [Cupriavidus sp. TKC]|uniref:helix-turn-helix domain-containing protein n=1 Tax=Cupriavidus TaxID=106589 RepID=UPI000E9CB89C|nr:XRE family transcriptional regulator [Cupriavidus sp.]HBO80020.1 XRE family transcriptional regulator [Cupriavidus sp.]